MRTITYGKELVNPKCVKVVLMTCLYTYGICHTCGPSHVFCLRLYFGTPGTAKPVVEDPLLFSQVT